MAHDLRKVLRLVADKDSRPSAVIFDGRTIQSTPEGGHRAGYDGYKRKKGSKVHAAVDTLGHLLAIKVTAANEQERAQVVERSFAWASRFRRLARDYERLPQTVAGLHWLAFLTLMSIPSFIKVHDTL